MATVAVDRVVGVPVKPEARPYVDAFRPVPEEPEWLARFRRGSLDRFAREGFPSRRSENWRYLDLQPLQREPLLPAQAGQPLPASQDAQLAGAGARLVVLDGRCEATDTGALTDGVWLGPMHRALRERPDLVRLASEEAVAESPFAALNAAFFADGFVLDIPPGVTLDAPVQVVHFASVPGALHTRSLINLGAGSRATIVETHAGEGRYWRNDVVAVRLGAGAELNRSVLVEESAEAVHLGHTEAHLGDKARYVSFVLLLGGQRMRHEVGVRMGEAAHCEIDGAYLVAGNDEANIVTTVDHAAPGGTTSELIKGVAADRGHGAFQGRMIVREHAQKTDAHQLSRNLIIGQRAVIDTKPELEIYADDVKCSHGATVGELDEAMLFYLRARGIPAEEARRMLIEGFLREPVETVADPGVRDYLLGRLVRRLGSLEGER